MYALTMTGQVTSARDTYHYGACHIARAGQDFNPFRLGCVQGEVVGPKIGYDVTNYNEWREGSTHDN